MEGTFDGLTDAIKEMGNKAMQKYLKALKDVEELIAKNQKGKK